MSGGATWYFCGLVKLVEMTVMTFTVPLYVCLGLVTAIHALHDHDVMVFGILLPYIAC